MPYCSHRIIHYTASFSLFIISLAQHNLQEQRLPSICYPFTKLSSQSARDTTPLHPTPPRSTRATKSQHSGPRTLIFASQNWDGIYTVSASPKHTHLDGTFRHRQPHHHQRRHFQRVDSRGRVQHRRPCRLWYIPSPLTSVLSYEKYHSLILFCRRRRSMVLQPLHPPLRPEPR